MNTDFISLENNFLRQINESSIGCIIKCMKAINILLIPFLLSSLCFSQTTKLRLTNNEKSAILQSLLSNFFSDFPDEFESKEVILSTKNIINLPVPKLDNVNLIPLSPDEVDKKAISNGFLDYLVISEFEVKKAKVFVTLESIRVNVYKSNLVPRFGHGFIYAFNKKAGKWRGTNTDTTVFTNSYIETGEN